MGELPCMAAAMSRCRNGPWTVQLGGRSVGACRQLLNLLHGPLLASTAGSSHE